MLCLEMYTFISTTIVCQANKSILQMKGEPEGGTEVDKRPPVNKGSLLCHQTETISNCRFYYFNTKI